MSDFLSQDEVNALLKGVANDEELAARYIHKSKKLGIMSTDDWAKHIAEHSKSKITAEAYLHDVAHDFELQAQRLEGKADGIRLALKHLAVK